jgi:hypothetical protein
MAADKEDVEIEEVESPSKGTPRRARPAPRGTRGIFILVGLVVFPALGWLVWYAIRKGELPDLLDEKNRKEAVQQLQQDAETAREKSRELTKEVTDKMISWSGDLNKLLKGKPPETKEEISTLVNESKEAVARETAKQPEPSAKPRVPTTLERAQESYNQGQKEYVHADPAAPSAQVQRSIRLAAPYFEQVLALCEKARAEGVNGAIIDRLEQDAAKRLSDCRRRMEMKI